MERKQLNTRASRLAGDEQNLKQPAFSMSHDVAPGQVGPKSGKLRQESKQPRPSERLRHEEPPSPGDGEANARAAPSARHTDKKAAQSGKRMEKSGDKLNAAREKAAAQKPPKKPGPIQSAARVAHDQTWRYVHGKLHQVERENVGTESAHKAELAGERLVRGGIRFMKRHVRTRPARQARKWERKSLRAKADYAYRQLVQENPGLQSNPVSRLWQKQRLKRQVRKQTREAAKHGKKAVKFTDKIARTVAVLVKRNPKLLLIGLALFLLIVVLQSCMAGMASIGNGLISVVGGTSYGSSDRDIEAVEASYTALEKDLRERLARIERDYPGYDEYRYAVDEIGHDPFELASYLTAKYGGYTPAEVQAELQALFGQQYTLTITETVEVRYRTETRTDTWTETDPETGETITHSDTYTVEVPYDYFILNVTLRNQSLGAVAIANLDTEQQEQYDIYQKTKGNRPNLFAGNIYAHAGEYTDYDIPPEAWADPAFAALIAEAEKYLGYPYVWGGSSPATSFDCSGFISYVFNQSGVYPMSRTTAQGIFNLTAKIPRSEAKPGDLIFFTGTYDSSGPVSHLGIYVGENRMLHSASGGVQYARTDSTYWTEHFYAMGRL